ncbi:MAG: helix-turn-helix domain-containing protein [Candidatus Scatovivens sp.]
MYNLALYKFGELFRKARKDKGISIDELSTKLGKTKTTIYKYERNEIIPDILTVLEICNILEVNFNDLANIERVEEEKENSNNPFSSNKLYIYYLGFKQIVYFELEIKSESGFQKVYFKHSETGKIYFVGTIESSQDIAYINMKNYFANNKKFEKVQIIVNLKYSSDDKYMGLITGTDDVSNIPMIKKCLLTNQLISDDEELKEMNDRLSATKQEIEEFKKEKFWNVDISNKTDYKTVKVKK